MSSIKKVGRKLFGTCAKCGRTIRINGIMQGVHFCDPKHR